MNIEAINRMRELRRRVGSDWQQVTISPADFVALVDALDASRRAAEPVSTWLPLPDKQGWWWHFSGEDHVAADLQHQLEQMKEEVLRERRIGDSCRADASRLGAQLTAANERVEALSKPVSDEEWYGGKSYWQPDGGMRSFVDAFIASRRVSTSVRETHGPADDLSPVPKGAANV